jgi:hypothetical protein
LQLVRYHTPLINASIIFIFFFGGYSVGITPMPRHCAYGCAAATDTKRLRRHKRTRKALDFFALDALENIALKISWAAKVSRFINKDT